ncbi:MAG: putative rane protein [Thermoleophilaceae bacterium]|nr:putative rane protein [Thermoleophilaceae bacterium]
MCRSPSDVPELEQPTDATRRTRLANERTYLAWWRTGLASFAVAIAAGQLLPALANQTGLIYEVLGGGFTAVGIAAIVFGTVRYRDVERALDEGRFVSPSKYLVTTLAGVGIALGVLVLFVVLR